MPYLGQYLFFEVYSSVSAFELIFDIFCSLQVLLEICKAQFVASLEFPKIACCFLYGVVGKVDILIL